MNKLFVFYLAIFFSGSIYGDIVQCIDKKGKKIFTDNKMLCVSESKIVDLKPENTFSPSPQSNIDINYRTPERLYKREFESWDIFYEAGLAENDPDLYSKARIKLRTVLHDIESVLPHSSLIRLKRLKIYVMWGEASSLGGKGSGMRYVRKGETKRNTHYDPKWDNSIVIYSAANLIYLSDLWTKKAITHEFAHAWHLLNWPEKYPAILTPWENAKGQGLYRSITDIKGKAISSAYSLTNNLEYFAEISAIYFVGGNYHPFNKSKLFNYDPQGYQMVESLWGVN